MGSRQRFVKFDCPYLQATSQRVIFGLMSDVTRILSAINQGDPHASDKLLPLVYDELRKLAGRKMAQEKPGQTLQGTALVHEAYLRLIDVKKAPSWNSRGHFFAAAAEAMRRILVDNARRKQRPKHGGNRQRIDLNLAISLAEPQEDLVALDDVLAKLAIRSQSRPKWSSFATSPVFPWRNSPLS